MNLKKVTLPIPTDQKERTLRILLPDDYETSEKRYPVLYMHDGQNLFEDHTSFSGASWQIKETLDELMIKDIIVIGIDNSDLRLFEYSPWPCVDEVKKMTKIKVGGLGDIYATWVTTFVKPFIDSHYRTLDDFKNTYVAGSSMGAYISVYMASKYPDIYQTVGSFSLASWFNEDMFLSYVDESHVNGDQKFFISVGSHESHEKKSSMNELYIKNSQNLKQALIKKGIHEICYIETGDRHHELAWRKMFKEFIRFALKK
ncbi:MAG: alpha/beta hydrolase-fold protein [Acholeplasmataceae bacterium]|jgi:predicted alpha/beta superfamily hydrolase|nr:alpha/beta hydrolase-fold protein [Acholeplasmataceae bacterium]